MSIFGGGRTESDRSNRGDILNTFLSKLPGVSPDRIDLVVQDYMRVMNGGQGIPIDYQTSILLNQEFGYDRPPGKIIYSSRSIEDFVPQLIDPETFNLNSLNTVDGILIPEKAWHMAVYGPLGDHYAQLAAQAATEVRKFFGLDTSKPLEAVEFFTGIASWTASQKRHFDVIATVEQDVATQLMARHNLQYLGINGDMNWVLGDASEYARELHKIKKQVDVVFADPEWSGLRLHQRTSRKFKLSDMSPSGRQVVEDGFLLSPLVVLKLRHDVDVSDVKRLAELLQAGVGILTVGVQVGVERTLIEKIAFFIRNDALEAWGGVKVYEPPMELLKLSGD